MFCKYQVSLYGVVVVLLIRTKDVDDLALSTVVVPKPRPTALRFVYRLVAVGNRGTQHIAEMEIDRSCELAGYLGIDILVYMICV